MFYVCRPQNKQLTSNKEELLQAIAYIYLWNTKLVYVSASCMFTRRDNTLLTLQSRIWTTQNDALRYGYFCGLNSTCKTCHSNILQDQNVLETPLLKHVVATFYKIKMC